jgi:Zn-dependent protease
MRDLFSWSFPLGRLFGVIVRVHWLFPVVALGVVLRVAALPVPPYAAGMWVDAVWICLLTFFCVLLHEFGHCFGARAVEGDASEILMWPLGGLAYTEVPNTPRANFITTAAGPAVNLVLCLVSGLLFCWVTNFELRPAWNPFFAPFRCESNGAVLMYNWAGDRSEQLLFLPILLYRIFWVNWVLLLLNVLVIGFPLDGGRMFQAIMWRYVGYHKATMYAVMAGFGYCILGLIISLWVNDVLLLGLAMFIYVSCRQQWIILETGGEEQPFGYDFSQGYTSLERDQAAAAPPRRKQPGMIQRWLQKRQQRKLQREQEEREAEERRMDELLEKVQRDGLQSLTDEERRFLTRVSARYRNRH